MSEIDSNLLSVKKLDKEGYKITFEGGVCSILKGDVNITTEISAGLYRVNAVEQACVVLDNQHGVNSQHMWHEKFGIKKAPRYKSYATITRTSRRY